MELETTRAKEALHISASREGFSKIRREYYAHFNLHETGTIAFS